MSMPIVATAVPKMPPTLTPFSLTRPAWSPSQWLTNSAMPIVIAVTTVVSKPTAVPEMMFVAGPVLRRLGDLRTGPERAGRVVLGDVDEGDARRQADDAGGEEVDPGREAARRRSGRRSFIITYVVIARPTADRMVVTQ